VRLRHCLCLASLTLFQYPILDWELYWFVAPWYNWRDSSFNIHFFLEQQSTDSLQYDNEPDESDEYEEEAHYLHEFSSDVEMDPDEIGSDDRSASLAEPKIPFLMSSQPFRGAARRRHPGNP
jgi:hypothetical protein